MLAWPYALGCTASRVPRVEDLYLEGAQAHEHVAARVRPVRGVAVPAVEHDHAVLVSPHALPRDHVETFPGQGKQGPAVLREQDGLLLVLGVVGLPAELQAPVRQSGVEVLQVPHARFGHEQLAPDHADLRLDRALLVSGVRRAQGALEPVVRLERLEQAGPADAAPPVLRPTPAALSNTMRSGTPPSHSNRSSSAWHVHSAFSPGMSCARPMFEYGKSSTKWRMRWTAPL